MSASKDLCRRLAKSGYLAIAPELFARQGDVSKIENIQEIITELVSKVADSQGMSDLDSTVAGPKRPARATPSVWPSPDLLGRPRGLALRGAQREAESRRGLERPDHRPSERVPPADRPSYRESRTRRKQHGAT
jgi:hypothetical protein